MISSHQIIGDEVPIQQTTAITELRGLESSPEAILCNVATQQGGKAFVDHSKRLDVGLILFPLTIFYVYNYQVFTASSINSGFHVK